MAGGFIDKKGRFTIPRAVHEALHFEPGTAVAYTCVDGESHVTRLDEPYGPVARAVLADFERNGSISLRELIE